MEKFNGVLADTLLEILWFLVVFNNSVSPDDINHSTGTTEKKLVLNLIKQKQNFA